MDTVDEIIEALGSDYLTAACGVSKYSLRAAKRDGVFPSSWYRQIKRECDRLGLDCPMSLFSFKQPRGKDPEGKAPPEGAAA